MNLFTSNFKFFLIFFLFSTLLLFFTTIFLVESKLSENKDVTSVVNYLLANGDQPFVALGDSHVDRAFKTIEKVDNLGSPGDNINMLLQKLSYRIINNKNPLKGVILQADPHMFSFYRIKSIQKLNLNNQNYFLNFLHDKNKKYLFIYAKLVWSNLFTLNNRHKSSVKKMDNGKDITLWRNNTMSRVHLHTPVSNFKNQKAVDEYLEIIKMLKKRSIGICMVTFPVTKLYREFSKQLKSFENVKTFFKRIAKKNNLEYVDMSDSLDDSKFSDPDHLKAEYSEYFTEIVKKKCNFTF